MDTSAELVQALDKQFLDGEASVAEMVTGLLGAVRRHLDLEVAFVSEFVAGRRVFRYVDADVERQALTTALIEFARHTGYKLIAEGIETEAERRTLQSLGVAYGQGYLFSLPQAAHVFRNKEYC